MPAESLSAQKLQAVRAALEAVAVVAYLRMKACHLLRAAFAPPIQAQKRPLASREGTHILLLAHLAPHRSL
jgi:hypothetical protein